jgi:hypothetical protein
MSTQLSTPMSSPSALAAGRARPRDPAAILAIVGENLMHESMRLAETARAQLTVVARSLRALDPEGLDQRTVAAHLSLVSVALDQFMSHVKTACESALGPRANLDLSRSHPILAQMRTNLGHDLSALDELTHCPNEFMPELEANADRAIRRMHETVATVVDERDVLAQQARDLNELRESAH